MCYCKTHYDVVKHAAKDHMNFKLIKKDKKNWDVAWTDRPVPESFIKKMMPWQRVNHFPGVVNMARKNMLARNLSKLSSCLPLEYNFFPTTYSLPHDYKRLIDENESSKKIYIVKPEADSQGRGIYLMRDIRTLKPTDQCVVQKYIMTPYLINGLKFDLRIYVLLTGVNPPRIHVYNDGLARFATVPYEKPADHNLHELNMHLTNYAINKNHENFVPSDEDQSNSSKRSMKAIMAIIKDEFGEAAQ